MPAIPIPTLSHLPKVSSISAKSSRLRKVSFRAMTATASVAAFPFRPALSHLPKVCGFPAKSSRLRKVSFRAMTATASVAAFPFRPALSHLRKVCGFPAKSSRLRKVSSCAMPATASVATFPFRPALSHLPKVSYFPAKSSRLRKVSSTISYLPTGPVPDSHTEGAGRNGILPPPSEFRYMPTCLRVLSRQPCPGFPSGRCRRKWLFTVTFQNQPNQPELSSCP